MAITAITRDQGINVSLVRLTSSDDLATVAGAGYLTAQLANTTALNNGVFEWLSSDAVLVYASDGHQLFQFSGDDFTTLVAFPAGNGDVTLPVVANDFVMFDGTLGGLYDLGFSASNPEKSIVVMANGAVTVGNIAVYEDTAGTVGQNASTAINNGNIQAGMSGTAGILSSFPATGSKGSLQLEAVANTGNTLTTISNDAMGQASVINIPDPGNAIGQFLVGATATPFVSGNFPVNSGTAGKMVDSGVAATNLQAKANIKAATTSNIGGSGAGPLSVTVSGMTSSSVVVATISSSSNPASVISAVAGSGSFAVTLSTDPGASCLLNYVAFIAAQ